MHGTPFTFVTEVAIPRLAVFLASVIPEEKLG